MKDLATIFANIGDNLRDLTEYLDSITGVDTSDCKYEEGYSNGYRDGYDAGEEDGYEKGFKKCFEILNKSGI